MTANEERPQAGRRPSEIVIEGLVRRFGRGRIAIDGLTARIEGGRITGLVGPDGAGKTTLLRLICGLLIPSRSRPSRMCSVPM